MSGNLVLQRKGDPRHVEQIEILVQEFDANFYSTQLSLRGISVVDPVSHYLTDGWQLGLDPCPAFSTSAYLKKHDDIRHSGMNPFLHYLIAGRGEQRELIQSQFLAKTDLDDSISSETTAMKAESSQHEDLISSRETSSDLADISQNDDADISEDISYISDYREKSIELSPERLEYEWTGENDGEVPTNVTTVAHSPRRVGKSFIGNIDGFEDGKIYGWILSLSDEMVPMLFVDDQPVLDYDYPVKRPDVNEHLGITGDTGFIFEVGCLRANAKIQLYMLSKNKLVYVSDYQSTKEQIEESFMLQLKQAQRIAKLDNSIAITCWDGSHNPVGRAKVLYDIVSRKRPAIIITYIFSAFGDRVWTPIRSTNVVLLTIPWARRGPYLQAILNSDIKFDTVWICKPRFPSFELAKLVSKPETALILDFDDNEEQFSKSVNARNKPYGQTTINYSRFLTKNVIARTAASISLKQKFDAFMIRHARNKYSSLSEVRINASEGPIKLGFIGTARPHKNLLEASRAIKSFNWSSDLTIQLHVYGDIGPASLAKELAKNDVVVKQKVPMAELYAQLEEMDIVLTGFPSSRSDDSEVTAYQISSKIGDALAIGRPVLVPEGESVSDLKDIPGVFLFDTLSFSEMLYKAISYKKSVSLPEDFTLEGAYRMFRSAEEVAMQSPKAEEVFSILPPFEKTPNSDIRTLVLLWKQNDSGFYGRRVDQIARSYKRQRPSHRVIILELMHGNTQSDYEKLAENYTSEHRCLLEKMPNKRKGVVDDDGIELHQVYFESSNASAKMMEEFLLNNAIIPENSVFIVFPIIQFYKHIERIIRPYPKIMDVVDNQFSWGGQKNQRERVVQYYSLARSCDAVIFNSSRNFQFFMDNDVVDVDKPCKVISNWYEIPKNIELRDRRVPGSTIKNIIYSGNMNDRIDWELLSRLADVDENILIHLVGTASRGLDELVNLLENENVIYHGPLSENATLKLSQGMDAAIMPHLVDDISVFMNPLKLHMYSKCGISTVSTDVPGIEESELVLIASCRNAFIQKITGLVSEKKPRNIIEEDATSIIDYIEVIELVRNEETISINNTENIH